MKFIWTSLIFFIINTTLSGQMTISGTINPTTEKTAILHFYPTTLGVFGATIETTINKKGQFQFNINSEIAKPAVLEIANFRCLLFIFPEKSFEINIQFDVLNRPLISFTGTAVDNEFYLLYQNLLSQGKANIPQKLFEKFKPKDYLAYQTNFKQRKTEFLNKWESKLDQRLITWIRNDINYQYANNLLEYPNRELITHTPPKKYYQFLKEIRLNNDAAILQPSYQRFLLNYTNHQLFKPQKWGIYASTEKQFKFVRRYFFGNVILLFNEIKK